MREALQTVCGFLNGSGGIVLFGVRPDGAPEGQQVSDQTFREIAQALDRFEPPVNVPVARLPVGNGREILLNAIIHQDYSYHGGHVAVVVFDDRVEIRSYGRLPKGAGVSVRIPSRCSLWLAVLFSEEVPSV